MSTAIYARSVTEQVCDLCFAGFRPIAGTAQQKAQSVSKQLVQRQHQELEGRGVRVKGLGGPIPADQNVVQVAESRAAILRGLSRPAAGAASAEQHLCARLHFGAL